MEQETKSDNELIAEFMGAKYINDAPREIPGGYYIWTEGDWDKAEDLKYDTSWDWLMPVVEKIEGIRYIGIDAIYFQIRGHQAQIWTYFDVKEFLRLTGDDKNEENKFKVSVSGKTKIEAVYGAVVEFIKWYNSNKLP